MVCASVWKRTIGIAGILVQYYGVIGRSKYSLMNGLQVY